MFLVLDFASIRLNNWIATPSSFGVCGKLKVILSSSISMLVSSGLISNLNSCMVSALAILMSATKSSSTMLSIKPIDF